MSKSSKNFTFDNAPTLQMKRSKIKGLSYGNTSSFSLSRLYPCYVEEILPGDTFKVNTNMVCRLTSQFIKPIYGNIFADVSYFFVPWRLVCNNWSTIFGENKKSAWANEEPNPKFSLVKQTIASKSLGDYLELPVGMQIPSAISVLYNRAVALVWDEWYRDENYQQPMDINKGDVLNREAFNNNEWSVTNYTGKCPPVSKYKDYFTSCLPAPQKGSAINIGDFASYAPVITGDVHSVTKDVPIQWSTVDGNPTGISGMGAIYVNSPNASDTRMNNTYIGDFEGGATAYSSIAPSNLVADVSNAFGTVNDLRLAFQAQKILERDALGTRYVEHIFNTFGVTNPDSRLQRPELLNTYRMSVNVQQVASTGGDDSLAKLGAYSLTSGRTGFSKSFSEYGVVLGFISFKQYHSYQNGVPKRFLRKNRLDYYNPALAYIGMTPVMKSEIYGGSSATDIFGYQRAWSDYRHHQNVICGEMRSAAENSLDMWHIADDYENAPVASAEFMKETPIFLDRTITVPSDTQDQFIVDMWHDVEAVRVMPANPMPGLIDHY